MARYLPPDGWTRRADLVPLVAALGPENMRWVGGAVRDTVLGLPVADVDVATTLLPEDVMRRLEQAGIRAIPTGIDHGTVTAVRDGGNVEITTLRRDVATDGRHATIAFADDWRDDAARRDFTMNALYAHPETREISDYFGGLEDLSNRRIRFIGDARERIAEDHLRILRYFRFHARFGGALDNDARTACESMSATLKGLSRERVARELLGLLALPDPAPTVELMLQSGVWSVVLPETALHHHEQLVRLIAAEARDAVPPDPIRRLVAMLPPNADIATKVGTRLRLSRAQRSRMANAAGRTKGADPRALAYAIGRDGAIDRLLLLGEPTNALANWTVPTLPLKGGEIVKRGVTAGPQIAIILRTVETRWVNEGFPDRARVETILNDILAERDRLNT
ncbi:MAG: CCA tRNA nucleotidyltransferase [Pontixanthobacter sp.]